MREITVREVAYSTPQATLSKAVKLVDPVSGIIKSIMPNWLENGDARVFAYGAVATQASPFTVPPRSVFAGGASIDKEQSIAAAIGEAVERYCSAYAELEDVVYGSYSELASDAIHPSSF